MLLLTFAASLLLRLSISGVARLGFGPLLALVVAMEGFAAPVTIIVDAGGVRCMAGQVEGCAAKRTCAVEQDETCACGAVQVCAAIAATTGRCTWQLDCCRALHLNPRSTV